MKPDDFTNHSAGKIIRTIDGDWAFLPAPLPPKITHWSTGLLSKLSEAERNLAELASIGEILPNPHLFVRPFVRKEALLSSQIEGIISTLERLYEYEAARSSIQERSSDTREVHNYVKAMHYGLQTLENLPLSLRLIREIHAVLMKGVRGSYLSPGEFRSTQNFIGPPGSTIEQATYVPPPVKDLHNGLNQLESYIHAPSEIPELIRIALTHYQFEALHPFADGNGRIGRLLFVFQCCAWGLLPQPLLYISEYLEKNYHQYTECMLMVSQEAAWERWIIFFLEGISVQASDAVQRIKNLQAIQAKYRAELGGGEMARRLSEVIDLLLGYPIVTIRQVEKNQNIPYTRAQRYVEKLVEQKILREITGQTRNRLYQCDEILGAIKEPIKE